MYRARLATADCASVGDRAEEFVHRGAEASMHEQTGVMITRRSNTILYTDRWSDTVAFYRDALGFEVAFQNAWFVEFSVAADAFVSVADASRSTIAAGTGAGLTLSFEVDDLEAVRVDLVRAGAAAGELGSRFGASTLDVYDPVGNRLEFWSRDDE